METITTTQTAVLSVKNAHRASKVKLISNPEAGTWSWSYKAVEQKSGFFAQYDSQAVNDTTGETAVVRNYDNFLNEWEVVEWSYEPNFEDLYGIARDAFYMTSHSPEERALDYIRNYEKQVLEDMSKMPDSMKEEYFDKFRARIITLFGKHSRIMSAAITGPARFPTEKNRKANESYDKAARDFHEWRESQLKRAVAMIEAAKPQEVRDNEVWLSVKRDIDRSAATIFQIDTGKGGGYSRALFVSNLYGRLATLSRNVSPEMFAKAMDYIKELGEKFKDKGGKAIFTARHKVWKLAEEAEARRAKEAEMASREDVEIEFEGGRVVKCYSEDRLQIFHDEKPSRERIESLKKNGFRWAPSNGCWQRQLTNHAIFAASYVTPLTYETINSAQ